jgi:hypothetical protein
MDEVRKSGRRLPSRSAMPTFERDMEGGFDNQREAFKLLELIDAEFRTDPMSVQCFDLRIVQRVRECVEKRQSLVRRNPWMEE